MKIIKNSILRLAPALRPPSYITISISFHPPTLLERTKGTSWSF